VVLTWISFLESPPKSHAPEVTPRIGRLVFQALKVAEIVGRRRAHGRGCRRVLAVLLAAARPG